jgi:hypothetical protein
MNARDEECIQNFEKPKRKITLECHGRGWEDTIKMVLI